MQTVLHESNALRQQKQSYGGTGAIDRSHAGSATRYIKPLSFPNTVRWVPSRKAEVVDAVRNGFLRLDEACERYALSIEEFLAWQCAIDLHGATRPRTRRGSLARDTRGLSVVGDEEAHVNAKLARSSKREQ